MLFSRRMGGVAKEALMLVQSDLGPDEPIPSFLVSVQWMQVHVFVTAASKQSLK